MAIREALSSSRCSSQVFFFFFLNWHLCRQVSYRLLELKEDVLLWISVTTALK